MKALFPTKIFIALTLALSLPFAFSQDESKNANAPAEKSSAEVPPEAKAEPEVKVKLVREGDITEMPIPDSLPKGIWVVFESSPKLTKLYREAFQRAGYKLADSAENSSAIAQIGALYRFSRMQERRRQVDFGALMEKAQMNETIAKEQSAELSTRGRSLKQIHVDEFMLPTVGLFAASEILHLLGDFTGLHDGFNKWLSGDARGWCLINCENWKKFYQNMSVPIVLTVGDKKGVIRAEADTIELDLVPQSLFDRAIQELDKAALAKAHNASTGTSLAK